MTDLPGRSAPAFEAAAAPRPAGAPAATTFEIHIPLLGLLLAVLVLVSGVVIVRRSRRRR